MEEEFEVAGYRLDHMIGRGGNGVVWHGQQVDTGLPVAVKFLKVDRRHKRHAFFSEAQALARLNHPGIVRILDIGTTYSAPFEPGEESPYIVMEHVPGDSLHGHLRALTPSGAFEVLHSLLDVLSYAHARGIVHRDVKPDNVLLAPAGDGFELRLVDFGLAFGVDEPHAGSSTKIEGTPSYMAPEQIRGQHREIGPWTDLYAVGCIAWVMATGGLPFDAPTPKDILIRHLRGDLGAFEPRLALPTGFGDWVRRLLARSPYSRFQRAVEARAALSQLDAPAGPWLARGPVGDAESSLSQTSTIVSEPPPTTLLSAERGLDSWSAPEQHLFSSVAVPTDWRDVERSAAFWPSGPAHLRLFALREVELVGRERLRDALWSSLLDVVESGVCAFALLHGTYGIGKSRLARWLVERAHEASGAEVLIARHGAREHPAAGLARITTAAFRCDGLQGDELHQRIEQQLARHGVGAESREFMSYVIEELVRDTSLAESPGDDPQSGPGPDEQIAAVIEVVRAFARRRPVVLWLDDLHEAPTSARFVERLLRQSRRLPVLVVATTLDGADGIARHVSGILEHAPDQSRSIAVERLPDRDIASLVQAMVDPDQETLSRAVRRAEGSPLFAVELVNEWAGSGALVAGPNGRLVLAKPGSVVPDGLRQIWDARLSAALDASAVDADAARRGLEIGAALGRRVSNREWRRALKRLGLPPLDDLLRELIRRELVVALAEGWRFRHQLLQAAIVERAQEEARWSSHHAVCADVLDEIYPSDKRGVAARRAEHLLESEQYAEALTELWAAFREIRVFGELERCEQLLRDRERACEALELEPNAYDRVLNLLIASSVGRPYASDGPYDNLFEHVAAVSDEHGYHELLAQARRGLANRRLEAGDCAAAVELYDASLAALDRAEEGVDPLNRMYALVQRGTALHRSGHTDEALQSMAEASALARKLGPMYEARTCFEMVTVSLLDGRIEHARWLAEEGLELARSTHNQRIEGVLVGRLGDVERNAGNFAAARTHYRRVQTLQESGIEVFGLDPAFKIALLDLVDEGTTAARTRLQETPGKRRLPVQAALDFLSDDPDRVAAARAAVEAHSDDWLDFDIDAQFLCRSGLLEGLLVR